MQRKDRLASELLQPSSSHTYFQRIIDTPSHNIFSSHSRGFFPVGLGKALLDLLHSHSKLLH